MARQKSYSRYKKNRKASPALAADPIEVTVTDLGLQGDGIAKIEQPNGKTETYFIRNAVMGDILKIRPLRRHQSGVDAEILDILSPSENRIIPKCPSAAECGGCQFQYLAFDEYQRWKTDMVQSVLKRNDIEPVEWRPPFYAPLQSRRRARLAWKRLKQGVMIGFKEARSYRIIAPNGCLILDPDCMKAIDVLRDHLLPVCDEGISGDVDIMLSEQGWDIALRPDKDIPARHLTDMIVAASHHPIARLSRIHASGEVELLIETKTPAITWSLEKQGDTVTLSPPPGSFLQAVTSAEQVMQKQIADTICQTIGQNHQIIDLFCGSGTLSLPLLTHANPPKKITGIDSATLALEAMTKAAKLSGFHNRVETTERNLFKDPLNAEELSPYSAAVIDPPRAGAAAQMPALAASNIHHIMMVSCNPISFARDAKILIEGGFTCQWVQVIDQFVMTSHSELIAYFSRGQVTP